MKQRISPQPSHVVHVTRPAPLHAVQLKQTQAYRGLTQNFGFLDLHANADLLVLLFYSFYLFNFFVIFFVVVVP